MNKKKQLRKLAIKKIARTRGVSLGVASTIYACMPIKTQRKLRNAEK